MTLRRAPGPPDWPSQAADAGLPGDPRSRRRGLVAGGSVVLIALALATVGPWSGQTRILILLLGWIAAVTAGGWAYRGRSQRARLGAKLLLALAIVATAGAATLFLIGLQVRDTLAGSIIFGASGSGSEIAAEARSFSEGEPVYQVAHLPRRLSRARSSLCCYCAMTFVRCWPRRPHRTASIASDRRGTRAGRAGQLPGRGQGRRRSPRQWHLRGRRGRTLGPLYSLSIVHMFDAEVLDRGRDG